MPTVDGIHFPYTKEGIQKARAWAQMTGKKFESKSGEKNYPKLFVKKGEKQKTDRRDDKDRRGKKGTSLGELKALAEINGLDQYQWGGIVEKMRQGQDRKENVEGNISELQQQIANNQAPTGQSGGIFSEQLRAKKRPTMQTSQQGMNLRGSEGLSANSPMMFKKGGKVKMPKGWHV